MWRHDFFLLHDVHSQHVYHQEESLPDVLHLKENVVHLMCHMVDFKQTCGIKHVTLKAAKKLQVSGSTGKSNSFACLLKPKLPSC